MRGKQLVAETSKPSVLPILHPLTGKLRWTKKDPIRYSFIAPQATSTSLPTVAKGQTATTELHPKVDSLLRIV
jgi:hypothetical protein